MLIDLFLPAHSREVVSALGLLIELSAGGGQIEFPVIPCPDDMVLSGQTCVDILPWPDGSGEPLLGVSAIREEYLDLGGKTWDCVSLCNSVGKRVCRWSEWRAACEGTPVDKCGQKQRWISPDWARVMVRRPREMRRLDQHARAEEHPECVSRVGARMMTTLEEWVQVGPGFAFTRGFWAREGDCMALNLAHSPAWHGYSNACRCCKDAAQ
jgi:hypothetical protein